MCITVTKVLRYISIHPLRGEWDVSEPDKPLYTIISIHPLRGEWDWARSVEVTYNTNFNPPTPWGVGP